MLFLTTPYGVEFSVSVCWKMYMAHLLQGFEYRHCIFCIDEKCYQLRYGGRWHDWVYDLGDIQDRTIVGWEIGITWKKFMASHFTPYFWFVDIGYIAVNSNHRVTCLIPEDGVLGGNWLCVRNGTQRFHHCTIDLPGIIKKCTGHLHDEFISFPVEWLVIVNWWGVLYLGTITWWHMWMGLVLYLGESVVLENVQHFET